MDSEAISFGRFPLDITHRELLPDGVSVRAEPAFPSDPRAR
jgi:hypothetical protein